MLIGVPLETAAGETRVAVTPETAKKLLERMKIITSLRNQEDGEWGFHPMNAEQRKLGTAGDSVLGTSAEKAFSVAKAARMTDDPELRAVALDVLGRLRRHKVPRGGQSWECPLYEPDLLAVAVAVGVPPADLVEARRQLEDERR